MWSTECAEFVLLLFTNTQLDRLLRLILVSTWPSDSSLGEQAAPPNHPSFLLQGHCPEKLPQRPPAPSLWRAGATHLFLVPGRQDGPGLTPSLFPISV